MISEKIFTGGKLCLIVERNLKFFLNRLRTQTLFVEWKKKNRFRLKEYNFLVEYNYIYVHTYAFSANTWYVRCYIHIPVHTPVYLISFYFTFTSTKSWGVTVMSKEISISAYMVHIYLLCTIYVCMQIPVTCEPMCGRGWMALWAKENFYFIFVSALTNLWVHHFKIGYLIFSSFENVLANGQ